MHSRGLPLLIVLLLGQAVADRALVPLVDFAGPEAGRNWRAVNDGVMGGVSDGRFRITDDETMQFFGTLSLATNGDFTSVRTGPAALPIEAGDTLVARVQGDGREYVLNIDTTSRRRPGPTPQTAHLRPPGTVPEATRRPKRLKAHAAGKASRYTRSRLPVRLAYQEPQPTKSRALKREAAIKKLSRPQTDRLLSSKPTRRSRSAVQLTSKSVNPEAPMTGPLLHAWNMNLGYVKRLVADIPDDKLALQPAPGMNHAAWVLGHLACTADMLGAMLGVKPICPPDWVSLFDWNSSPSGEASRYPSKATLLKALEDAHAGIAAALPAVPESRWSETTPLEAVRSFLPSLGDCFVFVMAAHENMHLGQLSAWRRVQGMGRV